MKVLIKEKVGESFSRAALTYDRAAVFQRETGLRLIEKVLSENSPLDTVLDAGMGTGTLTGELALRSRGRVHGCDLAWGMVCFSKRNAKAVLISQADIEYLPYKNESFGIVFSNVAYQWVCDLARAFLEVRRILKKGGRFYFSILAKDSLKELHGIVNEFFKTEIFKDFLPHTGEIEKKLEEAGLKAVWTQDEVIKRYYANCLELLRAIKQIGAGRVSGSNLFGMGARRKFFDMINSYDADFGEGEGVFATYRIMTGCAEK